MTSAQKTWLDKHPDFHVVGVISGRARYVNVVWLYGDGRTEVRGAGAPPQKDPEAFQVGQRIIDEGGAAPMTPLR
jgi:hypothetical protein